MGLFANVRNALTLRKVYGRLKEASMSGTLKATAFALGAAFCTAVVAQFTGACPGLLSNAGSIITATLGAGIMYIFQKPAASPVRKSLFAGAIAAVVSAGAAQLEQTCGAGFVEKIPAILTASGWTALGLFLKSPQKTA